MAIVIAVAHSKGGVGKTVVSVNLAAGLARSMRGKGQVVLLDFDAQGSATDSLCRLRKNDIPQAESLGTVLANDDLLAEQRDARSTVDQLARRPSSGWDDRPGWPDNLFYVPTRPEYIKMIENVDPRRYDRLDRVAAAVRGTNEYQIVVIDTNATVNRLTVLALELSDFVLIPTQPLLASVRDLNEFMTTVETVRQESGKRSDGIGSQTGVIGIVVNKYRVSHSLTEGAVIPQLQEAYGDLVFNTILPENVAFEKAATQCVDIWAWGERHGDQDVTPVFNAFLGEFNRRLTANVRRREGSPTVAKGV